MWTGPIITVKQAEKAKLPIQYYCIYESVTYMKQKKFRCTGVFCGLYFGEKGEVGYWRMAWKQYPYKMNRSQDSLRWGLEAGALGWPRGVTWGEGRWRDSGCRTLFYSGDGFMFVCVQSCNIYIKKIIV